MTEPATVLRIDKWLWAARFYKTRSLAADEIEAGRVSVNGERAKPAKMVRVGDVIVVRKPPYAWSVTVRALSDRRGPASEAQGLYSESAQSIAARAALTAEFKAAGAPAFRGRPTKRDRRALARMLGVDAPDDSEENEA